VSIRGELLDLAIGPPDELTSERLDAVADGDCGFGGMAVLVAAEYRRRLVYLRVLLGRARRDPASVGPLGAVDAAWTLLERAEASDPIAVRQVLSDPHLGLWLAQTLRRWNTGVNDETPRWVQVGHLRAVAAAAAIRAGVDFSISVPVRHGRAILPDFGLALLPVETHWDTADVICHAGAVTIRGKDVAVSVPEDAETDGPQWLGLRKVRAEVSGQVLTLALNDLDPYQLTSGFSPPERLSPAEVRRWRELFPPAWEMLVRDHPQAAQVLAAGMRSLVPLPAGGRFRPRSGSSGDGFGCALMSLPDDAVQLAVTLVHEFRHSTLSAVMRTVTLHEPDSRPLYAPWRDDPRPLAGLFQGLYAFTGVTDFWRRRSEVDSGPARKLADFEFALWSRQTSLTLQTVRQSGSLTPLGRRFTDRLAERFSGWQSSTLAAAGRPSTGQQEVGIVAALDHRASWRAHHLSPPADLVQQAAEAWTVGRAAPPAVRAESFPPVQADPDAAWLDVTAILERWQVVDPAGFARVRAGARDQVIGATAADVAYVANDFDTAFDLYLAEASAQPDRPAAWARLGQVAAALGRNPAAVALLERPELARAVHRAITVRLARPVSPWAVVDWLSAPIDLDLGSDVRTGARTD
jgi:HEXXH motif-containing protein